MLRAMEDVAVIACDSLNKEERKAAAFELRAVARSSRTDVLRRVGFHRTWSLPRAFQHAEDIERGTLEQRLVVDVHGAADHGDLGVYRDSIAVLDLWNELLLYPGSRNLPGIFVYLSGV